MLLPKIYHLLLTVTFAIHWAFLALLVGTPFLALVEKLRGKTAEGGPWSFMRHHYPYVISGTITTGVAPLLFSQTLFHRGFYQSFINLHPLPVIGLVMLIAFFYIAYLIKHIEQWALPLTVVEIGLLLCFMLFWGALYNGINHPELEKQLYWNREWPPFLWHSTGGHLVGALIAAGLYYALRGRHWAVRAAPLLGIGLIAALVKEYFRLRVLGDNFPRPVFTRLDPSMLVFLLFFVLMFWVLAKSFRIAFPPDAPAAADQGEGEGY